jgi:phosphate transport system substrate-binding protein
VLSDAGGATIARPEQKGDGILKIRNVYARGVMMLAGCGMMVFLGIAGCGKSGGKGGMLQIKGSDTMVNANQKLSEEFMKDNPDMFVAVTGGGSGVGIASLISKSCDIAAASREMTTQEIDMARKKGVNPIEKKVAYDGVAVILNKNNPVEKLTILELNKIFTGEVTNWKEFGGKDLPIVTLSREVSSGTYAYFKEEVIHLGKKDGKEEFSSKTLMLSSSQAIVEEVVNTEAAIGYLGMGYLSDRIHAAHVAVAKDKEYFSPDMAAVMNKTYPLSRPLYFYYDGQPQGLTKLFVDFTLSPRGQKQFEDTGFVPLPLETANVPKTQ